MIDRHGYVNEAGGQQQGAFKEYFTLSFGFIYAEKMCPECI